MAKFKAYDYRQRVFLPVSLEDQLLPGTLEFAIHTLVETRLDTSGFEQKYRNDETGRTAYDPKILLKIVLLGYARGLISSRRIEQACRGKMWSLSPWLAASSLITVPSPPLCLP
jgi:transposase